MSKDESGRLILTLEEEEEGEKLGTLSFGEMVELWNEWYEAGEESPEEGRLQALSPEASIK